MDPSYLLQFSPTFPPRLRSNAASTLHGNAVLATTGIFHRESLLYETNLPAEEISAALSRPAPQCPVAFIIAYDRWPGDAAKVTQTLLTEECPHAKASGKASVS